MALLSNTKDFLISGTKDFFKFDTYRKHDIRSRCDLVSVAETHVLWKTRLGYYIQGNIHEPLELSLVGQDGICQLESWINSMVLEPFCDKEVYSQLIKSHQQFHQFGALIIEKLQAEDHVGAAIIFKNEYSLSLRRIIQSLTEINKQLQD